MKNKSQLYSALLSLILLFAYSCKLDNYDSPNASVSGKIIDASGEAVQSDISGTGVKITYIEKGNFESPQKQSIGLKGDGTYRNNLMFAGTYDFFIKDANFLDIDTVKDFVVHKGENVLDFTVDPYIRITIASLEQTGTTVVAKFTMKTLYNNLMKVDQVQLFSHIDPVVSFGSKIAYSTALSLKKAVGESEVFTLQIDLSQQSNNFSKYPTGTKFWFRIGAMVLKADASPGSTPKWNYSNPVQLSLTL